MNIPDGELPILRTSERSALHRCWQLWWWAYRMGLSPRDRQADARWFGIGIHIALERWYLRGSKRGPLPADTFAEWVGDEIAFVKTYLGDNFEEASWEDARELGIAMLTAYVDHYGRDDQWEIIAMEEPFKVRISRQGKPVAIFASRWDGVFRDRRTGLVLLMENKTAGQINTAYLEMDPQAGAYCAVANQVLRARKILKPNERINGVQYNFLRKAKPDDRPEDELGQKLNKDGSVSQRQPPPLFVRPDPVERSIRDQKAVLDQIADEVYVMGLLRDGTLPLIKNQNRDCPRCDFWVMCQLHEHGGDAWEEVMRSSYRQQDPYTDIKKGRIIKSAGGGW